jgi:hypothetical protein
MQATIKKLSPILMLGMLISSNTTQSMDGRTKIVLVAAGAGVIGLTAGMYLGAKLVGVWRQNNHIVSCHSFSVPSNKGDQSKHFIINRPAGLAYELGTRYNAKADGVLWKIDSLGITYNPKNNIGRIFDKWSD